MEAHERFKKEGAVLEGLYGTPQTAALTKKLEEDKILGTSPGFGTSAASRRQEVSLRLPDRGELLVAGRGRRGVRQGAARRQPEGQEDRLSASTTIRPARSRWRFSRSSQRAKGFEMRTFAVPPPGVEMGAQVLDITGAIKPDFVIAHLFGRSPSVSIKELKGKGYPLSKVISLVWGSSEADIKAAGGYAVAEGYHTHPVRRRRRGLPGDQGHQCDVQGPGQAGAEGAGGQRVLQPRRHDRGDPRRGRPQRDQGQGRRQADQRGREEGLRVDQGLHAGRAWCRRWRSPPADHEGGGWVQVSRSRAASSSRTATGSAPIAT